MNYDIDIEKLVIISSVKDEKFFEENFKTCLPKIGTKYTLILTDSEIPINLSYNSVLKYKNIAKSKYLMFIHQDIMFLEDDWGKKIIDFCDGLPDLGYAGTECMTNSGKQVGYGYAFKGKREWGKRLAIPARVQTCDGGICLIPTNLFIERQFDPEFHWYPVSEDYACWAQYIRGLTVYCLPVVSWHMGGGNSAKESQKLPRKEKKDVMRKLHERYKVKIYTTGHGRRGIQ